MKAMLFDLDDTLVNSAMLREARDRKAWAEVFSRIGEIEPFSVNAHELPARFKAAGISTGLVTASPKPYVDQVLSRFNIDIDVVVTGSDGHPPKPDPSSLRAAITDLGVESAETAYLGDLSTDHTAAALAGATSIGALWAHPGGGSPVEWLKHWPDLALSAPRMVEMVDRWDRLGPIAEVAVAGHNPSRHRGAALRHPEGFSLGRYFTTSDQRANQPLSRAVLDNKHDRPDAGAFSIAVETFFSSPRLRERLEGAIVTSVPPSPDDNFDRFSGHRSTAADVLNGTDQPDLLRQRKGFDDYKGLRGREARDEVNINRFETNTGLDGQQVVLLDDVFTTGSQLASCREALQQAGAGEVLCLTLAYTQEPLPRSCPLCGGIMKLMNGRRGLFWGCSGFWSTGCRYTEDA